MTDTRTVTGDDPVAAWTAATDLLLKEPGHRVANLVVRIAKPSELDEVFSANLDSKVGKPAYTVRRVARTIMPRIVSSSTDWMTASTRLLEKLPTKGFYFRRMVDYLDDGGGVNQIKNVIDAFNRRTPTNGRWADPGPIVLERPGHGALARVGYPCLSQVQLHRSDDELMGTAIYRSHYYHDKAYGNFVGLGRLMRLVARECGMTVGELVVVSTDARVEEITLMRSLVA